MKKQIITPNDVENYLQPQLETLRALLTRLHCTKSLCALQFLQQIMHFELHPHPKNDKTVPS